MRASRPALPRRAEVRGFSRFDLVGIGLFVAFAVWAVLTGAVAGADPLPMASLILLTGATAFAAREVTRRSTIGIPVGMLTILLGAIVLSWPAAIHPHFGLLGYSNANGALYTIGVGASGLVLLRSPSGRVRIAAAAAGAVLAVLPWVFDSDAASVNALVVVVVTVLLLTRRASLRLVLPCSVLLASLVVGGTILAGLLYTGDGEGDGGWRLTERRFVLWSESVEMVAMQPVTGVGPGRFAALSATTQIDPDAGWSHHAPLQVAAETGVPGLMLLLGVLGWAYLWLERGSGHRGGALATVVLGLSLGHASIDYVWHFAPVPLALAALVGAAATAGPRRRE